LRQNFIINATIAALATPKGRGGIGIIRISGEKALMIAADIFRSSRFVSDSADSGREVFFSELKSHYLYHGHIVDSDTDMVIDEALLVFMKAPRSYTKEDVVEIQAHSGPAVLSSILELVLKKGARLAEPGEFTRRAYINGRIDLTQAEAVIDVVNARTSKALELANTLLQGGMREEIEHIRDVLLDVLATINAAIDFPDDVSDVVDLNTVIMQLQGEVIERLKHLINQYENAHVLRDGIKLVIVGCPNVGKSSLMNRLIQKDRAIVTSVPGTTRDLIEESLNIMGIPAVITDTAGLHETDDVVEVIGIKKTYEYTDSSDLVLFVLDAGRGITDEDNKIYERVGKKSVIIVVNKSDLVPDDYLPVMPDSWTDLPKVKISALYNQGLDGLKNLIAQTALNEDAFDTENSVVPNLRHKLVFDKSLDSVLSAVEGIRGKISFEMIAVDIQDALELLGGVTGVDVEEDMVDRIFGKFCIGK
jgi:tRNA modification GTPase